MNKLESLNNRIWKSYDQSKQLHDKLRHNGNGAIDEDQLLNDGVANEEVDVEIGDEEEEEREDDGEGDVIIKVTSNDIPNLQRIITDSNFSQDLQLELKQLLMKTYWKGFYKGFEHGSNYASETTTEEEQTNDNDNNDNVDNDLI